MILIIIIIVVVIIIIIRTFTLLPKFVGEEVFPIVVVQEIISVRSLTINIMIVKDRML